MPTRRAIVPPRQRILGAALTTFAERGVEGASVADVAVAAGMSKQALMHHFRTKEDLRDAVYALLAERLRVVFPSVAGELVRQPQDYGGVLARVSARLSQNPEVARFFVHELLRDPETVLGWLRTETAPWLGLVRGVIEQEKARGGPGFEVDVEAHVTVLMGVILAVSALVPRKDKRWWTRVQAAALRVMRLGSHVQG